MQKKIASHKTYQASIFSISKDRIEMDDGRQFERDIVHHHGGVGVLAVKDHQILLVKQYRPAVEEELIEIPAGKLEYEEDPYTAALRELEEESGYTCKKLYPLCEMYSTPGFCSEKLTLYYTKELIKVERPAPMDEDEEIELLWMDLANCMQMIEQGKIKDAKTIVAIFYAQQHTM